MQQKEKRDKYHEKKEVVKRTTIQEEDLDKWKIGKGVKKDTLKKAQRREKIRRSIKINKISK